MNEVLQSVRMIKYMAFETPFEERILVSRESSPLPSTQCRLIVGVYRRRGTQASSTQLFARGFLQRHLERVADPLRARCAASFHSWSFGLTKLRSVILRLH